ncbi:MAG: F0F1 ATP synthase subunit delta [Gammaproteobacteria bacterium]|nr:F0F1 ATP synthase subunit delta [Gammaproteobacteria bacterium]
MAEKTTIARPYAEAVFELAKDKGDLNEWSEKLELMAAIASNEQMAQVISNPDLDSHVVDLFTDIAGDKLGEAGANLVKLCAENGRLDVLPEIAVIYEGLKEEEQSSVVAEVISAYPLSDEQKSSIAAALKKRLDREVSIVDSVDENLIGGVVIRAGDLVIDGSAANRLESLGNKLMH